MRGRGAPQIAELQRVRDAGGSADSAKDAAESSRARQARPVVLVDDDRAVRIERDDLALDARALGLIERDLQLLGDRDRDGRAGLDLGERDDAPVVLRPSSAQMSDGRCAVLIAMIVASAIDGLAHLDRRLDYRVIWSGRHTCERDGICGNPRRWNGLRVTTSSSRSIA